MKLHPLTKDLIGIQSGRLKVIEFCSYRSTKSGKKEAWWSCICDCGNTKSIRASHIKTNHITSCGCRAGKTLDKGRSSLNRHFNQYKSNANKRQLDFNITLSQFQEIIQLNCHYCDNSPKKLHQSQSLNGTILANGVDRIDSNIGYVVSNLVPCCTICNRLKTDLSYDSWLLYLRQLYNFRVLEIIPNNTQHVCLKTLQSKYRVSTSKNKQRSKAFMLSLEEHSKLILSNCSYCGQTPNIQYPYQSLVNRGSKMQIIFVNTIDRIDSSKDYILDNCVTSCDICNFGKSNLSQEEFTNHLENLTTSPLLTS